MLNKFYSSKSKPTVTSASTPKPSQAPKLSRMFVNLHSLSKENQKRQGGVRGPQAYENTNHFQIIIGILPADA